MAYKQDAAKGWQPIVDKLAMKEVFQPENAHQNKPSPD